MFAAGKRLDIGTIMELDMKLKVQAQHLQPGDIVGSGEKVHSVIRNTVSLPSNKCVVYLHKKSPVLGLEPELRICHWGKYTMIGVERNE